MSTKQPAVLAPSAAEYVLPAPPRSAGEVVVVAPNRDADFGWRRATESARRLGERFGIFAEHQQVLLTELRDRIGELDAAIADSSRAQLKGALRDVLAVLEWAEVAQADLLRETRLAREGAEPVDVVALCEDVAAEPNGSAQPTYVTGEHRATWWGNGASLARLVRASLQIVAERTLGVGARSVSVSEEQGVVAIAIRSSGDPGDGVEADSVKRMRAAADAVGAVVRPDALGLGGSGMVLELPTSPGL